MPINCPACPTLKSRQGKLGSLWACGSHGWNWLKFKIYCLYGSTIVWCVRHLAGVSNGLICTYIVLRNKWILWSSGLDVNWTPILDCLSMQMLPMLPFHQNGNERSRTRPNPKLHAIKSEQWGPKIRNSILLRQSFRHPRSCGAWNIQEKKIVWLKKFPENFSHAHINILFALSMVIRSDTARSLSAR